MVYYNLCQLKLHFFDRIFTEVKPWQLNLVASWCGNITNYTIFWLVIRTGCPPLLIWASWDLFMHQVPGGAGERVWIWAAGAAYLACKSFFFFLTPKFYFIFLASFSLLKLFRRGIFFFFLQKLLRNYLYFFYFCF